MVMLTRLNIPLWVQGGSVPEEEEEEEEEEGEEEEEEEKEEYNSVLWCVKPVGS
jgi:hypothetical protein